MIFKDNTNRINIKLTEVSGQENVFEVERVGESNGTPLNAQTLNEALDKKQNKLVAATDGGITLVGNEISLSADIKNRIFNNQNKLQAGAGISIRDGVISATGESHPDYSSVVPEIGGIIGYTKYFNDWKMVADDPSDIAYGKEYGAMIGYEDKFALEFRLDDMHFSDLDTDPTVMIRIDGVKSVYCLFRLKKGTVRIVDASTWKNIGSSLNCSGKMPVVLSGDNISVKVERIVFGEDEWYSFYFNGEYLGDLTIPAVGGGRLKFGTIGCKAAVVRDWKIRRIGA